MGRMDFPRVAPSELRQYRNTKLYRPLARTLRVYNRRMVDELHARGFADFSPAFPQMLSNLDTEGTRIGVLAARAGVTRQAAGQLLAEIERCGYVERRAAKDDARATVVVFTARGKRLLATILALVEQVESSFAAIVGEQAFNQLRITLARIANEVDPDGAFGSRDEDGDAATGPSRLAHGPSTAKGRRTPSSTRL
jgi:DNA-binding MarR family transcriptional regulator